MSADAAYLDHAALVEGTRDEDVVAWARDNCDRLKALVAERGCVLLRGFVASDERVAERMLQALSCELLDDAFWSTPRSSVAKKTFTATEYPGPRTIALHSEMAYMPAWPRIVMFHALVVADEGGETTIGDLGAISEALADVLPRFEPGVRYQRTYRTGIDIPWQTAFRTENKQQVERVARKAAMTIEWLDDDTLRTTHGAQGCVRDEQDGLVWFNQSHVFHPSNLPPETRASLTEMFGEDQLPRVASFADGEPIPDEMVRHIHDTLDRHTIKVAWQPGDVLLIDNMRYMHGRMPFKGKRKLHVALGDQQTDPRRTHPFAARRRGGLLARFRR